MQCLSSMDTVQKIILLYQAGLKEEKKKRKKESWRKHSWSFSHKVIGKSEIPTKSFQLRGIYLFSNIEIRYSELCSTLQHKQGINIRLLSRLFSATENTFLELVCSWNCKSKIPEIPSGNSELSETLNLQIFTIDMKLHQLQNCLLQIKIQIVYLESKCWICLVLKYSQKRDLLLTKSWN